MMSPVESGGSGRSLCPGSKRPGRRQVTGPSRFLKPPGLDPGGSDMEHSKVPDKVHLDKKSKRKIATLYLGNLEYNASDDDIYHALTEDLLKMRVEDVTFPRHTN